MDAQRPEWTRRKFSGCKCAFCTGEEEEKRKKAKEARKASLPPTYNRGTR